MDGGFGGNWKRRMFACEEGKYLVGIAYLVEGNEELVMVITVAVFGKIVGYERSLESSMWFIAPAQGWLLC